MQERICPSCRRSCYLAVATDVWQRPYLGWCGSVLEEIRAKKERRR